MTDAASSHAGANGYSWKTPVMSQNTDHANGAPNHRAPTDEELREISASLRGLRYGTVNIVVQDGVIIQIDRTEKRRLRTRRESSDAARS
jgi:hypothetical protein